MKKRREKKKEKYAKGHEKRIVIPSRPVRKKSPVRNEKKDDHLLYF